MDKEKLTNILEAGSDILNQVNGAVKSGNYKSLNSGIRTTLNNTLDKNPTASDTVTYKSNERSKMQDRMNETMRRQQERNAAMTMHGGRLKKTDNNSYVSGQRVENVKRNKKFEPTPFARRKVNRYDGVWSIVGGAAVGVITLLSSVWLMLAAKILGGSVALYIVVFMILAAFICGIVLIVKGVQRSALAGLFHEYAITAGNKNYITVEELGNASGKTVKETLKSLEHMKKAGYLPYAELDDSRTTLMLTDEVKDEYRRSQSLKLEKEKLELADRALRENLPLETLKLIEDGEVYVKNVRKYNDMIPDSEAMSDKLYRLEDIMNRIFARVKVSPSNTGDLRKFMSYYLPTTEKLLNAYVSLSTEDSGSGDNVIQTKTEIEETMDTVCSAYENILDEMFDDIALDITSDISVMKTMMKQDGIAPSK